MMVRFRPPLPIFINMYITGERMLDIEKKCPPQDALQIAHKYVSAEYHPKEVLVDLMQIGERKIGVHTLNRYRIIIYFLDEQKKV